MRHLPVVRGTAVGVLLALSVASAWGQETATVTISRQEYEALRKEMADMRKEINELRQSRAATTQSSNAEVAALRAEVAALKKDRDQDLQDQQEAQDELMKLVKEVQERSRQHEAGEMKLLITGDAFVGFDAHRHADSTFQAGVAPRFLWEINKQLYFDAAMDIGIDRNDAGDNETTVDLTIADVSYSVNDYLVVGGGLFVTQFAAYHRYFDAPWINKLPDDPLVFGDNGLAPGSSLGVFASGAYPLTPDSKVNYAIYLINGSELNTNTGGQGFDNFVDLNNNKAVGGRVGYLPFPEMEIGYSVMCGRASPDGFDPTTNSLLQAVDFNYNRRVDWLYGNVQFRAEWVFSHASFASYDQTGANGGPFAYQNNRNGGYLQASYRPSLAPVKLLRNFEVIFRYDRLDVPSDAPDGGHEQRYTTGLDYWIDAKTVLKFAYECDDIAHGSGANAYLFQFGVGF